MRQARGEAEAEREDGREDGGTTAAAEEGGGDQIGAAASLPGAKGRKRRRASSEDARASAAALARSPASPAARGGEITRLSRQQGEAGCAVWLLASKPLLKLSTFLVHFGEADDAPQQPAELIAPTVLACVVPDLSGSSCCTLDRLPLRVTAMQSSTGSGAGRPVVLQCACAFRYVQTSTSDGEDELGVYGPQE